MMQMKENHTKAMPTDANLWKSENHRKSVTPLERSRRKSMKIEENRRKSIDFRFQGSMKMILFFFL